ncbi:MarR family winged helix-turn-helix transcriptional regulator [Microvirga sp. VF16]|uniref:MarR family winged helix-turn-helix transcriptional regulator n=1 Tax=Microvirga sp. VF16 TaxID=2807101 RepID=UPI00193E3F32|nr:MarR family winged helix-turn-helix transcriptional regulator [Microvirga sp. VF16]QRM31091.1 winged helix-turn-helix transcriptional regulator [Microvirga sp. VF16]
MVKNQKKEQTSQDGAEWLQEMVQNEKESAKRSLSDAEASERRRMKGVVEQSAWTLRCIMRVLRQNELSPQSVEILLAVALKPGLRMNELPELTGMALSSVSRNLDALGAVHRHGKPGLELVATVPDPEEPRRKLVFLTVKGRMLVERLLGDLEPSEIIELDVPTAQEGLKAQNRKDMEP